MRLVAKDRIRFAVSDGDGAAALEVRIRPGPCGGWQASALIERPAAPPLALGRVFRASDRRLAAGKMIAWVRRRFRDARPLAERDPRSSSAA